MKDNKDELIKTLEEYIELLIGELNETAVMASVHGWGSNRIKEGMVLRDKINQLKNA